MPSSDTDATSDSPLSLTRREAEQRAATIGVEHTEITLDLTRPGPTFDAVSVIRFVLGEGVAPGAETFVDFKGEQLVSVELNGVAVDPTTWRQGRIPLTGLREQNTVRIAGTMAYSSDGEGLHRHTDPADQKTYLYAMSFLAAAPRWFGCFDQPDLKSTYVLDVTGPVDWTVLGNGPSALLEPGRWQIRPTAPLSTYYVTLVAGPYASCYREHDGIRLGFHARASLAESLEAETADLHEVTAASFDYYHRLFGVRYPFGEYHQAFVPDFNAGAMENPGCVTLRDQYIYRGRATRAERASRAGTVAHEMAHMWFGDLVTMRWWDDLWLNESFAEYAAHRCCSEGTQYPLWTEFGVLRKDWGSVADQSPSTHPVAGNGAVDADSALQDFDGISYAKGAAVLKQLVAYLGDEVFLAGLRDYFQTHAYGNAALADLLAAWQRAGAADLDSWARDWLQTSGLDTLSIAGSELVRQPPEGSVVARPHTIAVAALGGDGVEVARQQVTLTGERLGLELVDGGAEMSADGGAVLVPDADDGTWAKIRFDADWTTMAALLPTIALPATRVVVVNAFRDAVRSAQVDPGLALEALLETAAVDDEDVVVGSVLRFCSEVLAAGFTAVDRRPERLARVHGHRPGGHRTCRGGLGPTAARLPLRHRQLRGRRAAPALAGRSRPPTRPAARPRAGLVAGGAAGRGRRRHGRHRSRAGTGPIGRRSGARGQGSGLAAGPGGEGGGVVGPDRAVGVPRVRAVRGGQGLLPTEPDHADERVRVAVLRRDARHRGVPQRLGTRSDRLGRLSARSRVGGHPALAEQTLAGELPAAVRRSLTDGTDALRRAVTSLTRSASAESAPVG